MKNLKDLMIGFFSYSKDCGCKEFSGDDILSIFDNLSGYKYLGKGNFYGFRESLLSGGFLKPVAINCFVLVDQKFFDTFPELEKKYKKVGK